tara:strand:+ start:5511 stop:5696 length:186 start_codon:yes stop_codon:yes gene_type:complete
MTVWLECFRYLHLLFCAAIAYEDRVSDFHKELLGFYYQKMFRKEAFDNKLLKYLPVFARGK